MSLTTKLVVSAMLRRTQDAGGFATVLARGDEQAGGVLILCRDRGEERALLERILGPAFKYGWQRIGPEEALARTDYVAARQRTDPDLWVIELDIADAERFVAESFAFD